MQKFKIDVPKECFCTREHYKINGRKYMRVTQTLSVIYEPHLVSWKMRVGQKEVNRVMTRRQNLGTTLHKLLELTLQGEVIDESNYEEEIAEDLVNFREFRELCNLQPEALEQRLWSDLYKYAGTADYIGGYTSNPKYMIRGHPPKFLDGALIIGDWKSSRNIYPKHFLQMAAYANALYELTGIKVDGIVVIQLRDGRIRVKEKTYEEAMELFEVYKHVLALYKWKHRIED